MSFRGRLLPCLLLAGAWSACAPHRPPVSSGTSGSPDGEVIGLASWYGPGFHGKRTASGEIYDQRDLTAAHKSLPFGTRILVRNLDNDRTCWVRINDRGPFIAGRVIDLSYSAAQALGVVGPGTARVRLEPRGGEAAPGTVEPVASVAQAPIASEAVIAPEPPSLATPWAVQVGAFAYEANAERLARDLARRGVDASVSIDGELLRVRVRGFSAEDEAWRFAEQLKRDGFEALVVGEP